MRILQQSPLLKEAFQKKVRQKISNKQEKTRDALGYGFLGSLGMGVIHINQAKNQFKGSLGENIVSSSLSRVLPDTWTMFKNALIPTNKRDSLTEIDLLIIGHGGVFLVEVKTWKGSFSAYRDRWKRRDGANWIALSQSPSSQSAYHQKMFKEWVAHQIPSLSQDFLTAPVIFPAAKWIGTTDCCVPILHGVQDLVKMIANSPNRLTSEQVVQISDVVKNYLPPAPTVPTPKPKPILRKNAS